MKEQFGKEFTEKKLLEKSGKKGQEAFLGKQAFKKSLSKSGKKGQVTVFIILGIVIVIILGFLVYVNRERITIRGTTTAQVEPIKTYLEDCIREVLDDSLFYLKTNAGHYVRIGNENIYGLSYLNTRTYYTNDYLERQISDDVKKKLNEDCSLAVFEKEFYIEVGEINVNTDIDWHETFVFVTYPIKLTKGEFTTNLENFYVSKKDDFGIMNAVAGKIVNDDTYESGFDLARWKENSIFKGEFVDVVRTNEPEGGVYLVTTPFDTGRYSFILEK